jgi:hypothetical protein
MSQIMDLCNLIAIAEQEENPQESQLVHIFCPYPIFPFVFPFHIVVAMGRPLLIESVTGCGILADRSFLQQSQQSASNERL